MEKSVLLKDLVEKLELEIVYKSDDYDNIEIKFIYKDILDFIEKKGGTTRKEIEEYINLSQTRVITLLKEMLELNLIRKEKDKIDRRSYKYYRK